MYARQSSLNLKIPSDIGVIGCGGIGSWVAIYSAMGGVRTISLFDPDILEIHNLNRLPYSESAVGMKKVDVLREYLVHIRPQSKVFAYDRRISGDNATLLHKCKIVFDCTDSTRAHRLIERLWDKKHFTDLIRASYDGDHYTLSKNLLLESISWGDETTGYQIVPSWVIPASFIAQVACWLAYAEDAPECYFLSNSLRNTVNRFITYGGRTNLG